MTETAAQVNWAGTIAYRARQFHRPSSLSDLQKIVSTSPRVLVEADTEGTVQESSSTSRPRIATRCVPAENT